MEISDKNLNEFATQRYTFVAQLISETDRLRLRRRALERSKTRMMKSDNQVPGTPAVSVDPQMEELLERLLPSIERIAQRPLFPTYSYFRVYKTGDVLERHTDREACEVSVSINLDCQAPAPWPISVEGPLGVSSFALEPGDGVIYRGIECPHWRDAFQGEMMAQVFLHYVEQHGSRAEWKFDKRRRLGTIPAQPVRIAAHVKPVQADGVLEFGGGKKAQLDPFRTSIMKDLEAGHSVSAIVQHALENVRASEFEVEAAVLRFITTLEEREIVILSNTAEAVTA